MKRFLFAFLAMIVSLAAWSQKVTLMLQDEPLASALRQIDRAQHERRIVFVLNDLDSLRVTRSIFRRSALEAVTEVCEGYPMLITEHEADILVEYVRPPVRLLPNAVVTRRQMRQDADGYAIRLHRPGMTGLQLLALLPHLTAHDDDGLELNGQAVEAYYLNGERLADVAELRQLPSDVIEEVRVNYRTRAVHVTLRKPVGGGYYGSLTAEGDCFASSAEGGLGGVWYSRYGKTSIYNRLGAALSDVSHDIRQHVTMVTGEPSGGSPSLSATLQDSRQTTDERSLSNRFSLTREVSERTSVGLSYYLASHRGNAVVRKDDQQGFIDFNGSNRHVDQELTLRYATTFGHRNTRLEALADYYSRQTTQQNVSLYGAGVGTEMGEAPSLSMWKASAELHHPMSAALTLHAGSDLRFLQSSYDPQNYLSNFQGSPTFLQAMEQHGLMLRESVGASGQWQRLRMEAGVAWLWHVAMQQIHGAASYDNGVHGYDYLQGGFYPYLQLSYPLDASHRHQLSLSYQRDMEDIPYAALSPAVRWNDAFNYAVGNRKLRSAEMQRWMVGFSGWEGRFCLTASHVAMHNEIYWQTLVSSGQTDVFYTRPVNLDQSRLWLLQAEANLRPTAGWQLKLDAQWQLRPEYNTIGDETYRTTHLRQQYACRNLMDCGGGWQASLNATFMPSYRLFDRTYHSRNRLEGEVQRSLLAGRLLCALTFRLWASDRCLDRQIGATQVSYRYVDSQPHLGLRAMWKFDGGRRVKVGTVEGAQQYHDIKDY